MSRFDTSKVATGEPTSGNRSNRRRHADRRGPRRVRSGAGALAYLAFIWLIINLLPTAILIVSIGYVISPPAEATSQDRLGGWMALLLFAILAGAGWYQAWRQASRSCCPARDGLHVRGWRRVRDVAFLDVLDVCDTPFASYGRGFEFAHTLLTYRDRKAGSSRTETVAAHIRGSQHNMLQILVWLPLGHPLRAKLPATLRDASELPTRAPGVVRGDARVTSQLRPTLDVLAILLGLLLVSVTATVIALLVCLGSHSTARVIGTVLLALLLALLLRVAVGVLRSRVDLTTDGLVLYQVFGRRVMPIANITGFVLAPSRVGAQVLIRQLVGPDRTSIACTGYQDRPYRIQAALQGWLELNNMHRGQADRGPHP